MLKFKKIMAIKSIYQTRFIITFLLSLFLFFGLFQLSQGTITKNIGEEFTITVNCSDSDGNLSICEVTSPCSKSCSASGSSGSCSCQFTCTIKAIYNACGKATDTKGLTDTQCESGAIFCSSPTPPPIANAGPDKEVFEGQTVVLEGSGLAGTSCSFCAEPDGQGGCKPRAAGEYGLPACLRCDGSSLEPVPFANNTQDKEGSNRCDQTCKKCNGSGSCTNQASGEDLFSQCRAYYNKCSGDYKIGPDGNCDGAGACNRGGLSYLCPTSRRTCQTSGGCSGGRCIAPTNITDYNEGPGCTAACRGCMNGTCTNIPAGVKDTYGNNRCTATHYACNGSGRCTNPCSTSAVCVYPTGGYNCKNFCRGRGYCDCKATRVSNACMGARRPCNEVGYSCECYPWLYD
jgi:hypothetical protein